MKYLILGQLSGIGGWQLYIDTRATYLMEKGIDVSLVSISEEKEIRLSAFKKCHRLCIPEVHMPPASYTIKQRNKIAKRLFDFIGDLKGEELIIESTDMHLSMWGEIVAKEYNGKNFCYLLHSHFPLQLPDVQDFFYFKYKRNELYGMSELTLPELFLGSNYAKDIEPRNFFAYTKDSISDGNELDKECEYIEEKKKEGYYVIGYFGNISKPHFLELCSFIEKYSNLHKERKFLFVSIGSSGRLGPEKRQLKVSKNANNCEVMNIPSLYPVPKRVFRIMDVCIASWGCSLASYRAGALTIRLLDDVTIIPHGIMGLTMLDYKDEKCTDDLKSLLEKVSKGIYKIEDVKIIDEGCDYVPWHKKIDEAAFYNLTNKEYYDIDLIKNISKRRKIEKLSNKIFGIQLTKKLMNIARVILAKPYAKHQRKETNAK